MTCDINEQNKTQTGGKQNKKKREPDVSRTKQSSILARNVEGTDIAFGNPTSKFNTKESSKCLLGNFNKRAHTLVFSRR